MIDGRQVPKLALNAKGFTIHALHNPLHPGTFIVPAYLKPNDLSGRELAAKLGVAASTLNRVLKSESCWIAAQNGGAIDPGPNGTTLRQPPLPSA